MKNPHPSDSSPEFGLIAWLESTRIALPLKGVECRFDVAGAVACVELDQIYHQNAAHPLDCTYTFPLPAGAAIYRCELHVNERVIRAKVEAAEAARTIYREQKAAGHRAALVEVERENLFTLSLGNVQPGDVIVVRIAWFQVLDRAGDGLRLLVPSCPGVRYIPGKPLLRSSSGRGTSDDTNQVADASRISPPRIDALHPDAAYFAIEGRLPGDDVESGTVSSPTHAIYVREKGDGVAVTLSSRGAIPDRDFVLSWREPEVLKLAPQAWRWREGNGTYALVQLRAPSGVPVAGGFEQDFYFLVDRSGSMSGAKWERTSEALREFVRILGPGDRVWITLFESTYRDFAEAPILAAAVLTDRGFQQMAALGTGGGTELLPAALHVLDAIATHSGDRRASVVLITDGQVGNEAAISSAFRKAPQVRVHTFGIDTTVNDAFLKRLARQHRGGCWLQTPDDDIAGTIAGLGGRLQRPVLTDLAVRGAWSLGTEAWPDLYAEEVVTVALRGEGDAALEIVGRMPDGSRRLLEVKLERSGSEAVKFLWARGQMEALLEAGRMDEAIAIARRYNLVCKGAAFIAWDEVEQVQIAREAIVQPAQRPAMLRKSHALCSYLSDHDSPANSASGDGVREMIPSTPPLAVLHLLSETFLKMGVPAERVASWMKWAEEDDDGERPDTIQRLRILRMASDLIDKIRLGTGAPLTRERWELGIRNALSGTPQTLLLWASGGRICISELEETREKLRAVHTPAGLIDHLFAWVMESGTSDHVRMGKLKAHADALENRPFSAGAAGRLWKTFLETALGVDSAEYETAMRLLGEAPDPLESPAAQTS